MLVILCSGSILAQDIKLLSWNIRDLGSSKNQEEIQVMAVQIMNYDVIAIQEVVGSDPGVKAMVRLTQRLNDIDTVSRWLQYTSLKTTGSGVERYGYIYKSVVVTIKDAPFLAPMLAETVDREPFICTFEQDTNNFTVVSFHAVPTSKGPETENVQLIKVHEAYPDKNLIFCGDFNQAEDHEAFDNLKSVGFYSALECNLTSLKMKRRDDGTSTYKSYDNFFYEPSAIIIRTSYVINFSTDFGTVKQARYISDHCPIVLEFNFR